MVITRKEKNGFGKDVNKTLELIAKLPQDIKDAVFEYLKGYSESNPVMNELIETAIQAVAENAVTVNTPVVAPIVNNDLLTVIPVSATTDNNVVAADDNSDEGVPLNEEQIKIMSEELNIPMDVMRTKYSYLTTKSAPYLYALRLKSGAYKIYA